jgi:WD40 repeat protein
LGKTQKPGFSKKPGFYNRKKNLVSGVNINQIIKTMTDSNKLENLAAYNQESLEELSRTLHLSKGSFSLIYGRCNYESLQGEILELLKVECPVNFEVLELPASATNLYTKISDRLNKNNNNPPDALMVLGCESVVDLERLLAATNNVRDAFLGFPFPIVIWGSDALFKMLRQQAADFNSFTGAPIPFSLPDEELGALICLRVDAAVNDVANFQIKSAEIEALGRDLDERELVLDGEIGACFTFLLGWDLARSNQIDAAVEKYRECLEFWRLNNNLERQGLVLLNLGLVLEKKGEVCWQEARDYLRESLACFESGKREDLVGKYLGFLGELLVELNQWDELKILAEKGLSLHESLGQKRLVAIDYGWLAEVALHQFRWREGADFAGKALAVDDSNILVKERGLFGFLLGQSLAELGKVGEAISYLKTAGDNLEFARQENLGEYDAKLHVEILTRLRVWQLQEKQYLAAFNNKQLQRQIETQYGWRAFVGAARLEPPAINWEGKTAAQKRELVRQIEAFSGRKADLERLVERIKNRQHKLTIIYGQSGVGKSSILQAGLIPTLQLTFFEGRDYVPVSVGVYKDWVQSLGQELSNWIPPNPPWEGGDKSLQSPPWEGGDRRIPPSPPWEGGDKSLQSPPFQGGFRGIDFSQEANLQSPPFQGGFRGIDPEWILSELRENEHRGLLTILVFDQFEEFFFDNPDGKSRGEFYRFLEECLRIPYLKVILSLREDYIYYLLEFSRGARLNIDKNYEDILYYLGNFSRDDSRTAIISLTERSKISLDSDLVEELVADLARQFDGVRPIELQLVGAQLESEEITTLKRYRELGEEPKEILVEHFLEDAVKDCGEENKRAAELVLFLLTNDKNTRPLKTARELKEDLGKEGEKLDLVLEVLVGSGLVLLVPGTPEDFYQLVHDYLVSFVRRKYEPQLLELQREREERRRLEKENQELLELQREREKRRRVEKRLYVVYRVASVLMGVLAGAATIFGVTADWESITSSANESQALMLSDRPFDAKLAAVKAGRKLLKFKFLPPTDALVLVTDALRQAAYKKEGELFQESNRLVGHKDWNYGASFSPDGKLIASVSWDKTVKLWNREGKLLESWKAHNSLVRDVSFSPDGETIATASYDNTVKLWSLDGQLKTTLEGHQEAVIDVSFSPDGELIATASRDKTVKLWSRDGKLLQTLVGHFGEVYGVSFSRDGELIASASFDNTAKLWSRQGKELETLRGHEGWVTGVSFSPDGELIATASRDKTVKLWSRDGELLRTLRGHSDWVVDVSFSRDGELIASASGDKTVKLWSLDGQLKTTLKGHKDFVNAASFSPDGKLLVTASDDKTVKLWSREGNPLQVLRGHKGYVNAASFSPGGELIATASDDKVVKLWSRNGELYKFKEELTEDRSFSVNALSVSFSPDGELIAAASFDNNVKLWSRDGKEWFLVGHKSLVRSISFSPDGELIATASWDKTVKLWSRDGEPLETLEGHQEAVIDVSFSPDGQLIATASRDNTVKLWSRDGKLLQTLTGHKGPVYGVSFSPDGDGELIASASWDNTVKLWRTSDGEELSTLEGHFDKVYDASFSPDGELIASASWDNTVKLWSRDGKLLQTLEGHKGPVISVSFSPDGQLIATASGDGTVILWDVWDVNDLMKLNCQWVRDYLRNSRDVEDSDRGLCDGFDVGE